MFKYRLLLKLGLHPVQKLKHKSISGIFFYPIKECLPLKQENLYSITKIKEGYNFFSNNYKYFDNNIPNWHKNYFNNCESSHKHSNWWEIPDFDPELGDIKNIWELSRFEWVIQLAVIASTGNDEALDLLNNRLNNWINENIPYKGVNWKCGQESSIRLMHLIIALMILNQLDNPTKSMLELIEIHVKRISPTISYAVAQNNNHGTSEAAALFIGGHFLSINGYIKYKKLEKIGRKWLEDRSNKLFSRDGCFSQYSVNYHRLALDTFCFSEIYRIKNKLPSFNIELYIKIKKATSWLESLTDKESGDTPNIGANDGARIFNVFNFDYRDFRPSVQWSNLVFNNRLPYRLSKNQIILYKQLGINTDEAKIESPKNKTVIFGSDDGFFVYKNKNVLLVFKRPIYKFRPSHSDALHVDLWINGVNVLRDGGTLSYNTTIDKSNYYSGTFSHNTVLFDSRNQMNKISRFLFGSWLKELNYSFEAIDDCVIVSSGYKDVYDVTHKRALIIKENLIQIVDVVNGFKNSANLLYRLPQRPWTKTKENKQNTLEINFSSNVICGDFIIKDEFESRYYNSESSIPVISKSLNSDTNFITNLIY